MYHRGFHRTDGFPSNLILQIFVKIRRESQNRANISITLRGDLSTFYCLRDIKSSQKRCPREKWYRAVGISVKVKTLRERATMVRCTYIACLVNRNDFSVEKRESGTALLKEYRSDVRNFVQ
jgi:hypothetical protein